MTLSSQSQRWLDKLGIVTFLGLAVAVTLGVKQASRVTRYGVKQIVAKVRRRK